MTTRSRKALTLFDDYFEMMSDRVRMDAYARAIEATVGEGDVVIDLGAGLGILSLLAARAGASRVYAIEKGSAAELAKRVAKANGLDDRIVFVDEHSLDAVLPEPADVLVSETLGSFALDENTLGFTIDVRNRLLGDGGRMVPQRLEPWLAPASLPDQFEKVLFWRDVAGFDYSPAVDEMLSRMSLASVLPEQLMALPQAFAHIDLRTAEADRVGAKRLFPIRQAGLVHGLAGWFRAWLTDEICIDTAPGKDATHWRQAVFPYREPVQVIAGDVMEVTLGIEPKSARSDDTLVRYTFRCTQLGRQ